MKLTHWVAGPVAIVAMLGMNAGSHERAAPAALSTGRVTLYAGDPIAYDFSFARGSYGGVFEDFQRKDVGADIDFSAYWAGELTVGLDGVTKGSIVDLGSVEWLQDKYRYEETVGGGQGFASIRREAGHFAILRDYRRQTTQELVEARGVSRAGNHVPVIANHVYLVRLASQDAPPVERFVKLLVVKHDPLGSVTLRWACVD